MLGVAKANQILDHITGRSAMPFPDFIEISLHNGENELDYDGYERQVVEWNAASDGVPATNDGDIIFGIAPSGGITVTHLGLWDDEGVFVLVIAIPPRTFPEGATPKVLDETVEIQAVGDFSDYLKPVIVNHMLGIDNYEMPTNVYLAVVDHEGNEFSGGSYARQETDFDPADDAEIENADEEDYGAAGADLGETAAWRLYDAAVAGNALIDGVWNTPAEVLTGDMYKVPSGGLTITLE